MSNPYRDTNTGDEVHTKLIETSDCELLFFTNENPDEPSYRMNFESSHYLYKNYLNAIVLEGRSGRYEAEAFIDEAEKGYFIDDVFVPLHRIREIKIVATEYKKLLTLKKEE